jgi:hypothetical protein
VGRDVLCVVREEINTETRIAFIGQGRDGSWPPRMSGYFGPNDLVLLELDLLFARHRNLLHLVMQIYLYYTQTNNHRPPPHFIPQNTYPKAAAYTPNPNPRICATSYLKALARKMKATSKLRLLHRRGRLGGSRVLGITEFRCTGSRQGAPEFAPAGKN